MKGFNGWVGYVSFKESKGKNESSKRHQNLFNFSPHSHLNLSSPVYLKIFDVQEGNGPEIEVVYRLQR